ncbi:TPM domain-containing protein [Verrucomicrobium spinosum]|uniref:TPM domain-containing protein n=1 Tax=Verrucomicrobium spinosum TaxID=2736 RepID=UPI00017452A5|nr:TPM domain-containing protein [Verrucomicrobium spinosum]
MRTPILLLLFAWLLAVPSHAAEEAIPPRPPSNIHDDARLFNPEQTAKLTALLASTQQQTGVRITVATFTYTSGITVSQRAQRLATAWLDKEPGLVFAFDRGSSQPAIAVSAGLWNTYPADDITIMVLRNSTVFTQGNPIPDERMVAAIETSAQQIASLETIRRQRLKVFTKNDRQLATVVIVVLALLGCASLWFSRRIRHKRAVQEETYLFPNVHVGLRLGAPFGGGTAAEVKGRK